MHASQKWLKLFTVVVIAVFLIYSLRILLLPRYLSNYYELEPEPVITRITHLFPGESPPIFPEESTSDRILQQLMLTERSKTDAVKTIYLPEDVTIYIPEDFNVHPGREDIFAKKECPVKRCSFVRDSAHADAVIFKHDVKRTRANVPPSQIWIYFGLESPINSGFEEELGSINWTATYRHDSDIVTPYEKWIYYNENITQNNSNARNYATGKTKQVAWFVSNCDTTNNRLAYAKELRKYIAVDIYGACGPFKCPRGQSTECYENLKKNYKFYLAFENSNCRDYITEKFFVNALQHDVIPIVMGAHPDDYRRVGPEHSYIHVDDFASPRDLAQYLHMLDEDDDLYNSYFRWKGTGEFIDTKFLCRLCAMLHNVRVEKNYPNLRHWWAGPNEEICREGGWLT